MADDKDVCFFVAPIGPDGSEIRKRSDLILKHVVEPVAAGLGYQALRADAIAAPGIITNQIIEQLVEAPIVVADLTGQNGNVFYELAIRHAKKGPVVHIIKKGEFPPFDVAGMRVIQMEDPNLDNVQGIRQELEAAIKAATTPGHRFETPISAALGSLDLRGSANPVDAALADIRDGIEDIRGRLAQEQTARRLIEALVSAAPPPPPPPLLPTVVPSLPVLERLLSLPPLFKMPEEESRSG